MNHFRGALGPEPEPELDEASKERDLRLFLLGEANGVRHPADAWTQRWPGFYEIIMEGWEIYVARPPESKWWHWRCIDENSPHWYSTIRRGASRSLDAAMRAAEAAWRDMSADGQR